MPEFRAAIRCNRRLDEAAARFPFEVPSRSFTSALLFAPPVPFGPRAQLARADVGERRGAQPDDENEDRREAQTSGQHRERGVGRRRPRVVDRLRQRVGGGGGGGALGGGGGGGIASGRG